MEAVSQWFWLWYVLWLCCCLVIGYGLGRYR
jgi:hypothetical protein